MADVFAAERIIWVEGETEELVFPFLYRELEGPLPPGTVFTSVLATGDFFGGKKRTKQLVYQIYNRLSSAVATLPIAVAFGFDTETLTEAQTAEMVGESQGKLTFLPRRHLECYLLDVDAIAARIRAKDPGSSATAESVEAELIRLGADRRYGPGWKGSLADEGWLARCDAANLIDQTMRNISEERVRFEKTKDALELVRHILQREVGQLQPLGDYVRSLVNRVGKSTMGSAPDPESSN
jgi:hypothetical protein